MSDGTGLAEAMLGLAGFKVLDVTEGEDELVIAVETTASVTGCWSCGVLAECQDRVRVDIRDLTCFGRPARLVWSKRRWRCREGVRRSRVYHHLDRLAGGLIIGRGESLGDLPEREPIGDQILRVDSSP